MGDFAHASVQVESRRNDNGDHRDEIHSTDDEKDDAQEASGDSREEVD